MKRSLRSRRWAPSIAAVAAFATLGATCAYWALQLLAPPIAIAPSESLVDTRAAPDLAAAQALFGSASAGAAGVQVEADVDVRVIGVAASPTRGSAVLVVGSDVARAYLVGDEVARGLRLVEVRPDAAVLERAGARIELAAPQRPSVALLWSGPADAAGTPAQSPHAEPDGITPARPDDPAIDAATLSPQGTGAAAAQQHDAPAPLRPDGSDSMPDPRDAAVPPDGGAAALPPQSGAAQSPRGGGTVLDPARFSGLRAGSVRPLGNPANAGAAADSAAR